MKLIIGNKNYSSWSLRGWLAAKLMLVIVLVIYHLWCGRMLKEFQADRNTHSHVFYRWFNEFPVLVLIAVVLLVVFKPF